ncbi:hypothetical protein [Nocardiopsis sp. LOL_012]|uniref:hypothetical protein n=1 Tax=Nocardiopsis sp. LOL_012 TaxID=3345409 RepID=UPI003A891CE5
MKAQPMVMVTVDIHVNTMSPVPVEQFHQRATKLMDELMALNECNPDISDPTVSSDAERSILSVEILVGTADQLKAVNKAFEVLHTALHAAGAKTTGWPPIAIDHLENRTEPVADIAAT